jgi:para-aminobenzoate synthetase component 1
MAPEINHERLLLQPLVNKGSYLRTVSKIKEHIQLGDIYEMNFCMEFYSEEAEIDPLKTFARLVSLTKAPYASLLKIKDDYIICGSPELFLKREGPVLYTKPIKGTARRGADSQEDHDLREELHLNRKERTENVMAVDVARNDLSVIAKRGTVNVNKLYNIETYETVHQMVSTVSCRIGEDVPFARIIAATFPMASMTGAPKISAMNYISEFESFERKYYSGAMGIIEASGDFDLAVNIRSIFYNRRTRRLSIAVGSAITYLSDPEREYEECLLKANAILKALNAEIIGES